MTELFREINHIRENVYQIDHSIEKLKEGRTNLKVITIVLQHYYKIDYTPLHCRVAVESNTII